MSPFLLHHIGRQTGMDEEQLKATMTSAVEGRISPKKAESAAISAAASHFAKQRRTHRAGTSRRGSVQATWVRNKRNSWEQTRPLMFAAQKMAEQQCGLSKEEAEKLIRDATAGKVASESVTEAIKKVAIFKRRA